MKKMLLLASLGLVGLSAQASFPNTVDRRTEDWRTEVNTERAEELAREYFGGNVRNITERDIREAMWKFPTFLEWEYFTTSTRITHLVSALHTNPNVLGYLLGFSPDLSVVDENGNKAIDVCCDKNLKCVFESYAIDPWVDPEAEAIMRKHARENRAKENASSLSSLLTWRTIGGIGAVALLGIAYNYYRGSSKEAKK